MKKSILLLITLTIFTNVSYAAFPVTENVQTEVVEIPNVKFNDPIDNLTLILAISWSVFFYVFHIPVLEWAICIGSICISPFFILSIICFLASIVVSIIALRRGKLKGMNSKHFTHWKAILSLLTLPLVIILELLLHQE